MSQTGTHDTCRIDASELRRLSLFAHAGEQHVAALLDDARIHSLPPYAALFEEGGHPQYLHVLLQGPVELRAHIDEQETTIAVLRPPSAFVLAAVIGDGPYLISARTLDTSRVLMLSAEAARDAFELDKAFARAVAHELSQEFNSVLGELKSQKLRTSLERVADWLLRADAQFGGSRRFTLPFDKRTLASQLGMTPENLSRNLKSLSGHGVIIAGRKVFLEDPAALAAVARRTPLARLRGKLNGGQRPSDAIHGPRDSRPLVGTGG